MQGQEEKVIFISTVVSRKHWMHEENAYNLLASPNRYVLFMDHIYNLLASPNRPVLFMDHIP